MSQDYILRFDVSVKDRVVMHFFQAKADILQFLNGVTFSQSLLLLDQIIQTSTFHVLHDDVKMTGVIKETIQFDNIRMINVKLNLDLVDKLVKHVFYLLFWNLFDGHQHFGFLVKCWKDLSKSSLSLAFAQLKVMNRQFSSLTFLFRLHFRRRSRNISCIVLFKSC